MLLLLVAQAGKRGATTQPRGSVKGLMDKLLMSSGVSGVRRWLVFIAMCSGLVAW